MAFGQYLKDTQAELLHVAWPTRTQTIAYTILVALISLGVALYLGLFDYVFTSSLTRLIGASPVNPIQVSEAATGTVPAVDFEIATSTQQ